MSWQSHKNSIQGVTKVPWDHLWHVQYVVPEGKRRRKTYDRVTHKMAMFVCRHMVKWTGAGITEG